MKTQGLVIAIAIAAACAAGGEGFAQPGRGERPASAEQAQIGEKALRERIEARREQLRRSQERADLAIKMLDEGAEVERVRDEYPEFFRQRQGGGPGGGGGDGQEPFDGAPPGGGRRPGMRGDGPDGGPDGAERFERGAAGGTPGGGERWRERMDRPLTDEERAAVKEFLRDAQPRMYALLDELEKSDPEEARQKIAEVFPRLRPLLELRKADPEAFELRKRDLHHGRDAMEAARWLAEHPDASEVERTAKREGLRNAMLAQFDARTEIQRRDLTRQGRRVEEAKAELEQRAADRESAVEATMVKMIERERERIEDGRPPHDEPLAPGGPEGRRRRGERG